MDGWQANTYGDRIAENYDELHETRHPGVLPTGTTGQTVDRLAALAAEVGASRVLELAIGTGRIALPLAERGITVRGIDASQAMVDQLRAKPGGDALEVTMGDFADVDVDGEFGLIYLVFNTLFNLTTQDAQVRCFANVARHLTVGGYFVVEAFVPDLSRFQHNQTVRAVSLSLDAVSLDASMHDPVAQIVTTQHILLSENKTTLYPVVLRYAWPAELDLMAQLAGLRLRDRWSDWAGSAFGSSSGFHISVYERAAPHPADRRAR